MKTNLHFSQKEKNSKKSSILTLILSMGFVCSTVAQSGKLSYQFNTDGDKENWVSLQNSTSAVSGGVMKVTFSSAQFPDPLKRRADFQHTGGATVNPTSYPIIAIKFNKPAAGNFTFDTNLGAYKNGANKWDGILNGDIYYYNIATGTFGSGATVISAETALTTFQFKIADITSAETDYSVDWIESFSSLAELQSTLGVNEINIKNNEFKIYPNPSSDKFFNINLEKEYSNEIIKVKIYNLLGNLVLEKTLEANMTRVDHNLNTGVYIVKVGNSAIKLIVK